MLLVRHMQAHRISLYMYILLGLSNKSQLLTVQARLTETKPGGWYTENKKWNACCNQIEREI